MALKLLSYNVRGLEWIALKGFRSSGADIIMIQETHFPAGGTLKFASKYFPTSFLASDSSGKAGVAILIRKFCPIRVKNIHTDTHGWFIILDCDYMSSSFTLVNIYAPNTGQVEFLNKVFDLPQYCYQPFMIVGGDFNLVISPSRDRQIDSPSCKSASQDTAFRKCVRSHQLFDSWRIKHPNAKQFTFYLMAHKMYSHLDHFLISAPLIPFIIDSSISPITWSDHAPITLDVMLSQIPSRSCHWRLNDQLLHSEPSRTKLAASLKEFFLLNVGSVSDFSTLWGAHR